MDISTDGGKYFNEGVNALPQKEPWKESSQDKVRDSGYQKLKVILL